MPITTKVVSLNPAHGEVYLKQLYVMKFVSDLQQVQWCSPCTLVFSTNKTDRQDKTEILLKVTLNTITQPTSNCIYGIDSDVVHSVCEPLKVRLIFPHMARCNGHNYVIVFFSQLFATDLRFSGIPVFLTNKTHCHDVAEMLIC